MCLSQIIVVSGATLDSDNGDTAWQEREDEKIEEKNELGLLPRLAPGAPGYPSHHILQLSTTDGRTTVLDLALGA